MQRLRELKQLGAAHLVYPGCTHSRFEHSVGTFHVVGRIMDQLAHRGVLVEQYRQAVAIAALVHDIAFVPYGHFVEDVLCFLPKHDGAALLSALDRPEFVSILGRSLHGQVIDVLEHRAPAWTRAVIASTIDGDMLDYLRRDAFYAGLRQNYDERIFRYLTVHEGGLAVETERAGLPRPDAVSELVNLLRLRYYLMERVYYHHAKLSAETMLGYALAKAMEAGLPTETWRTMSDHEFILSLKDYAGAPWVEAVRKRRLFKRAYVISSRSTEWGERVAWSEAFARPQCKRRAEDALAPLGEALICCLPPTLMKRAAVALTAGTDLAGHSPLDVKALETSYEELWRLYVFAPLEQCQAVKAAATKYFDRPSEYERGRKVETI